MLKRPPSVIHLFQKLEKKTWYFFLPHATHMHGRTQALTHINKIYISVITI